MRTPFYIYVALIAALLTGCSSGETENKKVAEPTHETHYVLTTLKKADLEQTLKLPAQLAAYEEVSIFPKVNGYVKNVLVDMGSHVQKGQLLMTLDAPEVQQQVLQAKEKYARSRSEYSINRDNYYRLKAAARTAGAIAPMDLATAKAKMEADSALSNSEKANWQMQQTMMAYLRVTAPFNGVISERNVHPGALVSVEAKDAKPMLELKQISHLRLQVDIPEAIAANLKNNEEVTFFLSAFPGNKMTARVSRKADNINIQYRSERIELDVANPEGNLSPGMYADVIISSHSNPNALIVPKSAVVTSTERKYVLAVRQGKTVKVDVSTGNESASTVAVTGDLRPGEQIIASANDDIKEGQTIK